MSTSDRESRGEREDSLSVRPRTDWLMSLDPEAIYRQYKYKGADMLDLQPTWHRPTKKHLNIDDAPSSTSAIQEN